jgi:hypothetical protein
MAKVVRNYGNVQFIQLSDAGPAAGAVIISHGGYTPRRGWIRTGSGTTTVPDGITLHFYTDHDVVVVGGARAVDHARTGVKWDAAVARAPEPGGSIVTNYSLSPCDDQGWTEGSIPASDAPGHLDVIMIRRKKAHLSDVFAGIEHLGLPYTDIHSYHCRVNKTTFEF